MGQAVDGFLEYLVAEAAVGDLHRLADKGHQQGVGLDDERLEQLVLFDDAVAVDAKATYAAADATRGAGCADGAIRRG